MMDAPLDPIDKVVYIFIENNFGQRLCHSEHAPQLREMLSNHGAEKDKAIAAQAAEIDRLRAALKPFAAGGGLFTATDESDKSSYVATPDSAPIGNRICWYAVPLTIGDLRRAYKALQPQESK